MGKAIKELNKLSYSYIEDFSLNEKFSEVKAEYHEGRMAENVVTLTEGFRFEARNQRLNKYHEALTYFVRCQTISLQVYNVRIAFATSPGKFELDTKD